MYMKMEFENKKDERFIMLYIYVSTLCKQVGYVEKR